MKGVPPEVDRLMWAVAEAASPESIEEFCGRHPGHRAELMRRVNMVQSLRNQVKSPVPRYAEAPRFVPTEPVPAPNPRGLFLAGALGIAAIATASYTAYSAFHPAHRPVQPAVVKPVDLGPPQLPVVRETPPVAPTSPPVVPRAEPNEVATAEPAYTLPKDEISVKDADLTDALTLISAGTGMKVVIGPGFVNQKVSVDYRGMSPLDAIQAMAKEYAFSVFDEGNGTFLILPVPDNGPGPSSGRPATRRIGP